MYSVVEFEKKECSIVPLCWITDDNSKCYWPKAFKEEKFVNFVKKKQVPRPTWSKYPICKVLYISETYEDAEAYLKKAVEQNSSTAASSDGVGNLKLLIKGLTEKRVSISDASEDGNNNSNNRSDDICGEPSLINLRKGQCQESLIQNEGESVRIQSGSVGVESSSGYNLKGQSQDISSVQVVDSMQVGGCSKDILTGNNRSSKERKRRNSTSSSSSHSSYEGNHHSKRKANTPSFQSNANTAVRQSNTLKIASSSISASRSASTITVASLASGSCPSTSVNTGNNFEEHIVRSLQSIETVVNQNSLKLDNLLRIQQSQIAQSLGTPSDMPQFPIGGRHDLKHLEQFLRTEENFQYLKCRLACVGGSNVRNCVMNILKFLLTNKLAMKYNWAGRDNKRPFKNLMLMKAISDATRQTFVRQNPADLQDTTINNAVKDWLRLAKARYDYSQRKVPL